MFQHTFEHNFSFCMLLARFCLHLLTWGQWFCVYMHKGRWGRDALRKEANINLPLLAALSSRPTGFSSMKKIRTYTDRWRWRGWALFLALDVIVLLSIFLQQTLYVVRIDAFPSWKLACFKVSYLQAVAFCFFFSFRASPGVVFHPPEEAHLTLWKPVLDYILPKWQYLKQN